MKIKASALAVLLMAAALLTACAPETNETAQAGAGDYTDYIGAGKLIAAQLGDVYGAVANDILQAKEVREFTLAPDMLEAVRIGRVDAAILDDAYVKQIQDSGEYPDLDYLPVPSEIFVNMASNVFHTEALRDEFNAWFETLEQDGTFDEIYNRWIGVSLPAEEDIPRFELTGENGTLRVCNTGSFPPFSYADSQGRPVGFDEELLSRFAAHMGMDIEYNMMAYDAIIPYVLSGKADMSACSFTVTGDRAENVIFGRPYTKAHAVLVIRKSGAPAARDYSYFTGKDVAAIVGATHYMTIEKIGGVPVYFNDSAEAAENVRLGHVSGFMTLLSNARVMASQLEGFEAIPVPTEFYSGEVAGISNDQAVIDRFNAFLASIKTDGTLGEMENRWFGEGLDLDAPIPEIENTGENGALRVATSALSLPYVYIGDNGALTGFSVELALRFGAHEGKTVEFAEMELSALIPYVNSGRAELSLSSMAITEERKRNVMFTEPFHQEQHGILALRPTASEAESVSLIEWLNTGIENNLLSENRWMLIVDGLGVTMTIAVLAQLFGTAFGCFVCWVLTRKSRFANWLGNLYCGLIHGLPIVVLLMITYYIIFGDTDISNVLMAVAAFTIITGAGVAVNLKGAIETVDPVEIEAARSIGFSAFKAFRTVTLPQAIRRALPGYTNGFVELVKATAIVGYIAIQDLTRAGDLIRSRTYDAYFPLLFVAVIYLIVTTICVQLFKFIVKKANGGAPR